jgi:hypothetical protein
MTHNEIFSSILALQRNKIIIFAADFERKKVFQTGFSHDAG